MVDYKKKSADEKKLEAQSKQIFKKSELLKGQPPPDQIKAILTPEFKSHLEAFSNEDPFRKKKKGFDF